VKQQRLPDRQGKVAKKMALRKSGLWISLWISTSADCAQTPCLSTANFLSQNRSSPIQRKRKVFTRCKRLIFQRFMGLSTEISSVNNYYYFVYIPCTKVNRTAENFFFATARPD
jgi:hypothetical protein